MNAADERACRVSLDVFDGPLDLLLALVRERRIEIETVSLATVADQYFAYVSAMEAIDVELAADYLVIAATLLFLKSRSLLPPIPVELESSEESPEAVEARLRERLLVYSKYREAGGTLRDRVAEASAFYFREGGDPATDLVQRYQIDPRKLGGALLAALRNARPERRTIVRERLTLYQVMDGVIRSVRGGPTTFFALAADEDRVGVVLMFLAVLELIRRGRLGFVQTDPFGDIALEEIAQADAA